MATAADLKAQADTAQAREDAERKLRDDEDKRSWLSSIVGSVFGGDGLFSLGNILMIGMVLTGAYFLAKTEMGQGLIQSMASHFSPETQAKISGFMNKMGIETDMSKPLTDLSVQSFQDMFKSANVTQAQLDVIAPTLEAKNKYIKLVAEVNNGMVTPDTLSNDKTIFALLTQDPTRAKAFANAALKQSGGASAPLTEDSKKVLTSITSIINSDRLDTLLNDQNRANTLSVLQGIAPDVSAGQLNAALKSGIDKDGHTIPEFRTMLTEMLTPDAEGKLPKPATVLAKHPNLLKGAIDTTITQAAADLKTATPQHPADTTTLLLGNNGGKAITALRAALHDDAKLAAFGAVVAANDQVATLKFVFENPAAFKAYATNADLKTLPGDIGKSLQQFMAEPSSHYQPILNILNNGVDPIALKANFMDANGKFSQDKAMNALLNPNIRAQLTTGGTENFAALLHEKNPFVTKKNLDAMLKFADEISASPGNMGHNLTRTRVVLQAFVGLATPGMKPADATKSINADQLSAFFQNPANHVAITNLLQHIDQRPISPVQKLVINTLAKDMGDPSNHVGLSTILSQKEGAQMLLDALNGKPEGHHWLTSTDLVQNIGMYLGIKGGEATRIHLSWSGENNAAQNRSVLMDLKHLQVTLAEATATTPPSTPRGIPATVRTHG